MPPATTSWFRLGRARQCLPDVTYERAAVWERADLVLKVKEPMEIEFERIRPEHVLEHTPLEQL